MKDEGAVEADKHEMIGNINQIIPEQMRLELMWTYCAAVSFVDAQLGRILDVMDKNGLWENTTVILTSDHGMHNGEKGIWEKWTLFDESTRVPLLISHPKSPFQGGRYNSPVELLDIYPTVLDLVAPPYDKNKVCKDGDICLPLQGKSLAGVVLGDNVVDDIDKFHEKMGDRPDRISVEVARQRRIRRHNGMSFDRPEYVLHVIVNKTEIYDLKRNFAITQTLRCGEPMNTHNFIQLVKGIINYYRLILVDSLESCSGGSKGRSSQIFKRSI